MQHRIKSVHFIGIGGVGMAGLAAVLAESGYAVSGSDSNDKPILARLRARGIKTYIGHQREYVEAVDCVVYSGAIPKDNVERQRALARRIPVIPRAQMLGELLRFKQGIAVSGSHGKTTVSSMVASILTTAELSPTCVIGGRFGAANDNSIIGHGDYVVVEADESDNSFLYLQPVMAVVTNIDDDHLDAFGNDINNLCAAFNQFLHNLPFYGVAIINADDKNCQSVRAQSDDIFCLSYGFAPDATIRADNITLQGDSMAFRLTTPNTTTDMAVHAIGEHNVHNALAAIAVALQLGVDIAVIRQGLANFSGVERRLQSYGQLTIGGKTVQLIDDYAHHPSEISATLQALRAKHPNARLLLVFQPHRYSRTQRLLAALADTLSVADVVVLTDIYAAGEMADESVLPQLFAQLSPPNAHHLCRDLAQVPDLIKKIAQEGDVIITMGAGSIGALPDKLMKLTEQSDDG